MNSGRLVQVVVVWICSPSGPSVKGWVTLTFDSSPIKGEGYWLVLSCSPASPATLWIPAYAGMTVMRCWNYGKGAQE